MSDIERATGPGNVHISPHSKDWSPSAHASSSIRLRKETALPASTRRTWIRPPHPAAVTLRYKVNKQKQHKTLQQHKEVNRALVPSSPATQDPTTQGGCLIIPHNDYSSHYRKRLLTSHETNRIRYGFNKTNSFPSTPFLCVALYLSFQAILSGAVRCAIFQV
jgi:hypothetical protein